MITANSYKLSGRNALVTGVGRRHGIGTAICRALAEAGANVFFSYWHDYDASMPWGVDKTEPEVLQRELQALGVQAEKLEIDLSNSEAPTKLIKIAQTKFGSLSILVNNATHSVEDSFEK